MDMKLDIRSRNVATGELMNAAEEAQWLRNQLAPHAPAPTQALVVAVNVDGTTVGGGLGRAREIAVASVTPDGKLSQWRVEGVGWDVWHDQGPHGSHHGRIVSFMRENQVSVVVSGHAGPPMVRTLLKLGILPVLGVGGDAQDAARSAAAEYREMLAQSAG
ncbi:NifB/NifX family molybdenum-iron cluster-binding protein [Mobiluncus mulieris]|uniref:Dinitrogenase iron-molybdenum cofactor biosynthesis domain-containing protein n=3 Tax=Mobiluncus mulieris TaxID=2052 RepID=E0QSD5_9ACTO|nr:NifB/NifX family molybdenum-iron cluster-binding protein [Mobiluncus mulieris]EEJ53856.1 hypothetical protein HMPREF0577_1162 [Mobiluncus mulieris ATCC 35243]EFM45510.1 hypothetical protein HMPREF0580_1800 [Mobiluncus mulieris ATCC 35239]MBB5845817.1 putative Fe-Mo cluster-binding NifX family protein [Mobiluncus mulieris]MCU9968995.1 hypothetical protein [Mobiluncus mulieris]MCU9971700.1 hypothetical protein [Mobiluncus mulieris]